MPQVARRPALEAGSAERGERLFVVKGCAVCHGPTAEGTVVGPYIDGPALSFNTVEIRVRAPAHPRMPPYGQSDLSDSDLVDIYTFLRSLRTEAAGR